MSSWSVMGKVWSSDVGCGLHSLLYVVSQLSCQLLHFWFLLVWVWKLLKEVVLNPGASRTWDKHKMMRAALEVTHRHNFHFSFSVLEPKSSLSFRVLASMTHWIAKQKTLTLIQVWCFYATWMIWFIILRGIPVCYDVLFCVVIFSHVSLNFTKAQKSTISVLSIQP